MASLTLGFSPRRKFVEVSITGAVCPLNCPMCRGRWLKGMKPTPTPDSLVEFAREARRRGSKGILISGGLSPSGKLPFRRFLWAIRRVKEMGYFISVHTGLVDADDATDLRDAGVDMADFELYLNDDVIRRIKGLRVGKDKYLESLDSLKEAGIQVAPHITLGIPGDDPEWMDELRSFVREKGFERLVVLVFIPTPGTPFWGHPLPPISELVDQVKEVSTFSKVSLGCMRPPRIKKQLDRRVISYVDRIANPHSSLDLKLVDACCSIPDNILKDFLDPKSGDAYRELPE